MQNLEMAKGVEYMPSISRVGLSNLPTFASKLISLKNNPQYYTSNFQQFNTEKDPITRLPFEKKPIEEERKGLILMKGVKRVWIP